MKLTEWKLEEQIRSKEELAGYLEGAVEEGDFNFILIACRDVLDIARKKGWMGKDKCRKMTWKKR